MSVNTFPASPLTITLELLINGTWHDISTYVYQRDGIQITGGTQSQGSSPSPATLNLTLNNRDGRFSPNYASGAYYPYLVRNTQIRLSVTGFSSTGVYYSGYRFWGEVPDWPPMSDISAVDVYVQIQATGPLRRINQAGGEGSALTRYYNSLTGSLAPVAYWPCEEDTSTTTIGAGIEGGTDMAITSVAKPVWKAGNNFNGSGPVPIVNKSTWDGITGSFGSSGNDVFNTPGNFTWIASTSSVDCLVWGGGGGGENGWRGTGGGGGEFARERSLAVTVGTQYNVTVGGGGAGGVTFTNSNRNGSNGGTSTFVGDLVTVTAHGGGGGLGTGGGAGGTGSGNQVHFNGGAGGSNPSDFQPGAGGGGAGGTAGTGSAGSSPSSSNPGNGGAAGTLGGAGGKGGKVGSVGNPGGTPGGGGGGGSTKGSGPFTNYAGGGGAGGQVQLLYTPGSVATTNVIRWIQQAPVHGGNPGSVLLRANTSGTALARLDVTYVAGGKMRLQGFDQNSVQKFDSSAQSWSVDGQPVMGSIELQNSGTASVVWSLKTILPGSSTLLGSTSGTVSSGAQVGNVSEVLVSPNGDITQTAMGHISVQYALVPLTSVSTALDGNQHEMSVDRFIRLGNEQALDNIPVWKEASDHWTYEATNATNFLTGNNATFDSGIGNWGNGILQGGSGSCTTTNVTTVAHTGAGCQSVTATSNGSMSTTMCTVGNLGTQGLSCSPGDVVYASAWVLTDSDPESANVGIGFFNSSNTFLSGSYGTTVYDTTNKWMQATQTATAPANTTHARMNVQWTGVSTGDVHYVDDAFMVDASTGALQSWTGTLANLSSQNTTASGWPTDGNFSLQVTSSGAGSASQWYASSPGGTSSSLFVTPGDVVSAAADIYTPSALGKMAINLNWYASNGTYLSTTSGSTLATSAGAVSTVSVSTGGSGAPASSSTFSISVLDEEAKADNTQFYVDNVRVGSRMGVQTRKKYAEFLEEIRDLDQGIMKEARDLWGLKHRTRIQLFNQSPAVTLNYTSSHLSDVPAPVVDDTLTANHVIVHRHKGSKVQVTLNNGTMSVQEPPGGTGRYKKTIKVIAELDEQLLNLANHLLNLGTVIDERYPVISVGLHRTEVASLFAAVAGVEIGDYIQIINLPFWYPNATAKQLVIGYTENITPFTWDISWNCTPEIPWEISATSLRRW